MTATLEDPRKIGLKSGIRQLKPWQIMRVFEHVCAGGKIVLDRNGAGETNHQDGCFCPLAVGLGLHAENKPSPCTDETVSSLMQTMGYKINNTRGLPGQFYTGGYNQRLKDFIMAAVEVLVEDHAMLPAQSGTAEVLFAVNLERARQDRKWGTIDKFDNRTMERWYTILGEEFGEVGRAILEKDHDNLIVELVQVAAVATAMAESLQRRLLTDRTDGKL